MTMSLSGHGPSTLSQSTFVGRDAELEEILALLAKADCRLVTLLGPGGVGKTRLALEVAKRFEASGEMCSYWVSLDGIGHGHGFHYAVADAVGARVTEEEVAGQVLQFLAERELLLVLDNFEDVMSSVPFVGELLRTAPGVSALVTSREALNLAGEWRFSVRGLPTPRSGATERTAAVELFLQRAKQVRPGDVSEAHQAQIAEICRMLDGVPLALELAAAWSDTLTFPEIADEIRRGLDLLATRAIDRPDRHKSMRAVFMQTIMRLTPEDLTAFRALCVFRGGFDRDAAIAVAGAGLPLLSRLSDRSLVWRDDDGRFRVHELLRQYAGEMLLRAGDELDGLNESHSDYYLKWLAGAWAEWAQGEQTAISERVRREKDNVLAALSYSLDNGRLQGIGPALHILSQVAQFSGGYAEGFEQLSRVFAVLQATEETDDILRSIAQTGVDLGWLCLRVGKIDEGRRCVAASQEAYEKLGVPPLPGASTDPDLVLGVIALIHGDYAEAERLGLQAQETAAKHGHEDNYPYALYVLAGATLGSGQYERAYAYGLESVEAAKAAKDPWFRAYCLVELGTASVLLGHKQEANRYFHESFEIRERFGDPEGMALALNRLGELALDSKEYRDAERLFQRSLRHYRDTDDVGGRATSRRGLAEAYFHLDKREAAAAMLGEALADATRIGFVKQQLAIIASSGELLARAGRTESASQLLRWVIHQPGADRETIERAEELLGSASAIGDEMSLEKAVALADRELVAMRERVRPSVSEQELVEPLTERELEVLYLLADGLTNQQIAEKLIVSLGTIKAHTHSIFGKLGAENRVQAVSRAREAGLIAEA